MDALEHGGISIDDKWALPQIINFEIDKMNPRVEIEFTKIEL
jgi:crossover junction endodeoxyribonuclease RusA